MHRRGSTSCTRIGRHALQTELVTKVGRGVLEVLSVTCKQRRRGNGSLWMFTKTRRWWRHEFHVLSCRCVSPPLSSRAEVSSRRWWNTTPAKDACRMSNTECRVPWILVRSFTRFKSQNAVTATEGGWLMIFRQGFLLLLFINNQ